MSERVSGENFTFNGITFWCHITDGTHAGSKISGCGCVTDSTGPVSGCIDGKIESGPEQLCGTNVSLEFDDQVAKILFA